MIRTSLSSLTRCSRFSLCQRFNNVTRSYSTSFEFELFKNNSLKSLIQDIKTSLPMEGIQEPTKTKQILNLLRMYDTNESDWNQYVTRTPNQSYTRNLVEIINNHSKLLVLVWEPGKNSKIHPHPNTDCFVKVLKGSLQEDLYDMDVLHKEKTLIPKRQTTLPENSVAFITDSHGCHKINNKTKDIAISLHLYVPQDKIKGLPDDSHQPIKENKEC
ncbi:Cysteine dioxygenase type 1 [Wickerhamomyces ciferrii]|uniref:Cysteine dioxygenase n=1 Tax=Wickerhamomyces ciferrii (strain ATCC 14091 / BCRC 22168 / CBS 111 / JCM 3599 / NBRC 0793 / NRRL Y-1031 F-60-10) TaxID=1206466 RepID=K0KVH5_WICCF|nr:Cysteine dioxygenase type 1 [Wickerhamomyces ciferrii]CCH45927.1 Cysteine dioxygenase type 1 [Wickerhamomyces ciferrii]